MAEALIIVRGHLIMYGVWDMGWGMREVRNGKWQRKLQSPTQLSVVDAVIEHVFLLAVTPLCPISLFSILLGAQQLSLKLSQLAGLMRFQLGLTELKFD